MKFKTYRMAAKAVPSCLLSNQEAAEVGKLTVTVEMKATCMGRTNRNRLTRQAFDELRKLEPKFPGCAHSVGGMLCGPIEAK
jgi:hypothetical protein